MRGRAVCLLAVSLAAACLAAEAPLTPQEQAALAKALAPSLVRVELTLQYDKGEAPESGGWYYLEDHIDDERPLVLGGLLLSPTHVLCADPQLHPRFVRGIAVRWGARAVEARPSAYALGQGALLLELAQPLQGARPLAFRAQGTRAHLAVTYAELEGVWTIQVEPLTTPVLVEEGGRTIRSVTAGALIVDRDGTPLGVAMADELPLDDAWKGTPLAWPALSAQEMARRLEALEKRASRGLLRVSLRFRSPRQAAAGGSRFLYNDEEESETERDVVGVLVDERRVLVLASLRPRLTARLERILVFPPDAEPLEAKFAGTLADFGCLVAELERPLDGAVSLWPGNILQLRNTLLLTADIVVHGQQRVTHFGRTRIPTFETGRRQRLYPCLSSDSPFLFDLEGRLVVLAVPVRARVTMDDTWWSEDAVATPAAYLAEALADLPKHVDPNNVPLTEEEENRLAWLGVELQPMTVGLARANRISHLTKDGEVGALVSFVYPGSPAAKAGVQPGFILLRLHVEGYPKPLDVQLDEYEYGAEPFPWDRLDEVTEDYYDHMPLPWPPVENAFTRALTELGGGKRYAAEFFHDGKVIRQGFVAAYGPPHFDSAPRFKAEALGLSVRDLTYEARRYFRLAPDAPGVVLSRIEMGSKASVAGLKPYEILTHVDEAPLRTVKDFQRRLQGRRVVRLTVKRMTRSRVVEIKLPGPPEGKAPEDNAAPRADPPRPDGRP